MVTGGGALSVGLETSCKRTLSLPVRVGYPKGLSGLVDEIKTPAFASSWGLIQYGVKHSRGVKTDSSIKAFGKILGKLPVKGAVNKAVEVIIVVAV